MNDKIMLENALTLTKSLINIDVFGVIEAATPKVKSYLTSVLILNLEMQEELYVLMTSIGIYSVEKVNESAIKQLRKKIIGNE